MKLYAGTQAWAEQLIAEAQPSVTIRSGVSPDLKPIAYWRELAKLKLRSLAHRTQTQRWLQLLNSHPAFSEFVHNRPRFLYKIYRPYLTNTLSIDARLAVLASHYHFIFERGLGSTVVQASGRGVTLATFAGKTGVPYQLVLRAVGTCLEREGELIMQLCQEDTVLYAVAFTFAWRGERQAVNIGCIQGGRAPGTMDAIRVATRELHGLRPKQMLATLVRQLGYQFGCAHMLLVSNDNRAVRGAMRQGRVMSDYDQLWTELGAERQPDGDFRLPCAPVQAPDMESIPSKKRSEARKRHEMLVALADAVNQRLVGLKG